MAPRSSPRPHLLTRVLTVLSCTTFVEKRPTIRHKARKRDKLYLITKNVKTDLTKRNDENRRAPYLVSCWNLDALNKNTDRVQMTLFVTFEPFLCVV